MRCIAVTAKLRFCACALKINNSDEYAELISELYLYFNLKLKNSFAKKDLSRHNLLRQFN